MTATPKVTIPYDIQNAIFQRRQCENKYLGVITKLDEASGHMFAAMLPPKSNRVSFRTAHTDKINKLKSDRSNFK